MTFIKRPETTKLTVGFRERKSLCINSRLLSWTTPPSATTGSPILPAPHLKYSWHFKKIIVGFINVLKYKLKMWQMSDKRQTVLMKISYSPSINHRPKRTQHGPQYFLPVSVRGWLEFAQVHLAGAFCSGTGKVLEFCRTQEARFWRGGELAPVEMTWRDTARWPDMDLTTQDTMAVRKKSLIWGWNTAGW